MKVKFNDAGLVPMIVQDATSGVVLSLFYANEDAVKKTKETGYLWRYSRSRKKLMKKGEESGNFMKVVSLSEDCDSDALLVKVKPEGPACHTGSYSCFGEKKRILCELIEVIKDRKANPKKDSFTSSIVSDRSKIIAKLREECEELIDAEKPSDIKWEAADLLFFMLVYLENRQISFEDVLTELRKRR
ncbi:MAG: bifunctional phosphoribosyl-AMP cyclohydrolase/phosphoribosyl-ATP diphosphatase HisIE [Candidatus Micrarchaeota archaeon]|nr:bifunctional phosphoribosyl-AMP cyclohydrolase/phosphoribosyl-ATP diphosphatase HisIE [Candidatus Micrarchaeota archaeon]